MSDDVRLQAHYSETMTSEGYLVTDVRDISTAKDGSVVAFRLRCHFRNALGKEGVRFRSCICTNEYAPELLKRSKGDVIVVHGGIQESSYTLRKSGEKIVEDQIVVEWAATSMMTRKSHQEEHHDDAQDDQEQNDSSDDSTTETSRGTAQPEMDSAVENLQRRVRRPRQPRGSDTPTRRRRSDSPRGSEDDGIKAVSEIQKKVIYHGDEGED